MKPSIAKKWKPKKWGGIKKGNLNEKTKNK